MSSQHDRAKRWQFGLRELMLGLSFASFCFALTARGHGATAVFLLAMPLWCWSLVQGAIMIAAAIHWHPRFTLRTVAIVVTLICCYAACWGPTKTRGVRDVRVRIGEGPWPGYADDEAVAPLLVSATTIDLVELRPALLGTSAKRCYYLWFFGYVIKLPYEAEVFATS